MHGMGLYHKRLIRKRQLHRRAREPLTRIEEVRAPDRWFAASGSCKDRRRRIWRSGFGEGRPIPDRRRRQSDDRRGRRLCAPFLGESAGGAEQRERGRGQVSGRLIWRGRLCGEEIRIEKAASLLVLFVGLWRGRLTK